MCKPKLSQISPTAYIFLMQTAALILFSLIANYNMTLNQCMSSVSSAVLLSSAITLIVAQKFMTASNITLSSTSTTIMLSAFAINIFVHICTSHYVGFVGCIYYNNIVRTIYAFSPASSVSSMHANNAMHHTFTSSNMTT